MEKGARPARGTVMIILQGKDCLLIYFIALLK
jgi:hypothetical protein